MIGKPNFQLVSSTAAKRKLLLWPAGGLRGAAASAAGRAAAFGCAASRRGYIGLGGIDEQKDELWKVVTLPLQVPNRTLLSPELDSRA